MPCSHGDLLRTPPTESAPREEFVFQGVGFGVRDPGLGLFRGQGFESRFRVVRCVCCPHKKKNTHESC